MSRAEQERLTLLDPLRILASVAVLWKHVRGEMFLGVGFGLFLFLLILFGLASSSTRVEGLGAYARRKARWLLVPWLRWSCVYLAVYALRDLRWGGNPLGSLSPSMLVYGGHPFLWFLPFAAGTACAALVLQRLCRRLSPEAGVLVLGLAGVLLANGTAAALALPGLPFPSGFWLTALPALAFGAALGQSLRLSEPRRRRVLLAVAGLAVAGWLASPLADGRGDVVRRYAVAVPLACAGFAWRPRVPRAVRALATTTFGIYLVHHLVDLALHELGDPTTWSAPLHAGIVWTSSSACVLALRRLRPAWPEAGRPVPALPHDPHELRPAA